MPSSRLATAAAIAGAGFALAACGSDAAPSKSSAASSSSSSVATSSAPASSSPTSSAASPTSSGSGRTGNCTDAQAKYCDDFSDTSSGWPTQNTQTGYTQYDPYLGGTYRIGLRGQGTVSQPAPVNLSDVSPTYSVQIDADVTIGQSSSNATGVGFRCWSGTTSSGQPTGFLLLVNGGRAAIGVSSSLSGEFTPIVSKDFTGLKIGETNHIAVQCIQGNGTSGVEARMAMRVNGENTISASYAKTTQQVSWDTTDKLSLVGQGSSADVFFDNLSVAPVNVSS